jgi:hypothetical protein
MNISEEITDILIATRNLVGNSSSSYIAQSIRTGIPVLKLTMLNKNLFSSRLDEEMLDSNRLLLKNNIRRNKEKILGYAVYSTQSV